MDREAEKRAVAEAAVALVQDGMTLGLGTGSTAAWFVRALAARLQAGLRVRGVPTSRETHALAASLGIPLVGLDEASRIDLAVDGADQIDPQLRLIKGGGGALLYEKIVASAADRFVVIADSSKEVAALSRSLPVEVVPFAVPLIERRLRALGGRPVLRGSPFVTDAGHHILDVQMDLQAPERLAAQLDSMPGVVEHGLFLGMAHQVLVADGARVTSRRP